MRIGFVGLGKLGLPCAVAMAMKGHDVMGYDINPTNMNKIPRPYKETGPDGVEEFNPYLESSTIKFGSLEEIADRSEIIFVAVQTPHDEKYEGTTRIPEERVDFNYDWLKSAISNLSKVTTKFVPVVVISTVLPGTMRREIIPLLNRHMKLCYNPFFIAMGTTMRDFLNPEFTLFGVEDAWAASVAEKFYKTITDAPFYNTTVENAELIKVAYNTFIGMKIVFANTLMEICHKTPGTNVDAISNALKLAHRRLISPAYLYGGMGDGGGCHPRDNIALSWLSRELNLSYDWFESVMMAREKQAEWLCDIVGDYYWRRDSKFGSVLLLGYSFKPESNITVGSPAILCSNIFAERNIPVVFYDPYVDNHGFGWSGTAPGELVLIGTKHKEFANWKFPKGSVVFDPFRYIPDQEGVEVIRIGE